MVGAAELTAEEGGVDFGAVVGDGGGHDEAVGGGGVGGEEGAEVLAGPEPVDVEVRRVVGLEAGEFVGGGGGAEEETDGPLAAERGIGEGEAHFAGGSVADEADGVDGFVGGAGGDEEGAAETEVGWGGGGQGGGSGRGRPGARENDGCSRGGRKLVSSN